MSERYRNERDKHYKTLNRERILLEDNEKLKAENERLKAEINELSQTIHYRNNRIEFLESELSVSTIDEDEENE